MIYMCILLTFLFLFLITPINSERKLKSLFRLENRELVFDQATEVILGYCEGVNDLKNSF